MATTLTPQHSKQVRWRDSQSCFELAEMYFRGRGVPQDKKQAFRWYRIAAENGCVQAQVQLGAILLRGEGVPKNVARAAQCFEQAALNGDRESCLQLGSMYAEGNGVEQSFKKSLEWFAKSSLSSDAEDLRNYYLRIAEQSNSAQLYFDLAEMVEAGLLSEVNKSDALDLYQRAADQEHPEALVKLALAWRRENSNPESINLARQYLVKAIRLGSKVAEWELSINRFESEATEENLLAILEGAREGYARSQFTFALAHAGGGESSEVAKEARSLLRQAADQGYQPARSLLGSILIREKDTSSVELGISLLQECAAQGDTESMYQLSLCWQLAPIERNRWLVSSAEHGHVEAQYSLAISVAERQQKIYWFEQSAAQGHIQSQYQLACELLAVRNGVDRDGRVKQLLLSAAESGHVSACLKLAEVYLEGTEEDDLQTAILWFLSASDSGDATASFRLYELCSKKPAISEQLEQPSEYWLNRAAEQGNAKAFLILASGEINSRRTSTKQKWLCDLLMLAANKGDVAAQKTLHKLFSTPPSEYGSVENALLWYGCGAEVGDASALYWLSECLLTANGTNYDPESAYRFCQESAEKGHAAAQLQMGDFHYFGDYAEQNLAIAADWYRRAAHNKNANAQFNLACMLRCDEARSSDEHEHLQLLKLAGAQGHSGALMELARFLIAECQNFQENPAALIEARRFLSHAAQAGLPEAMCLLAKVLPEDENKIEESRQLLKNAMELGYLPAYVEYAKLLVELGASEDAITILVDASELGSAEAAFMLGKFYMADPDNLEPATAAAWYKKAASLGMSEADVVLGLLHLNGTVGSIDAVAAEKCFSSAAECGNVDAMYLLGLIFAEGVGNAQDLNQAFEWFHRASSLEHDDSIYLVAKAYWLGLGTQQNDQLAIDWCKRGLLREHSGCMDLYKEIESQAETKKGAPSKRHEV